MDLATHENYLTTNIFQITVYTISGEVEVIKYLLEKGLDVNQTNNVSYIYIYTKMKGSPSTLSCKTYDIHRE